MMLNLLSVRYTTFILITRILSLKCEILKYASYCVTPENESGVCVPIKSCARTYGALVQLLNDQEDDDDPSTSSHNRTDTIETLRESLCYRENDSIFVCCPKNETQIDAEIYAHLSQMDCGPNYNRRRIAYGVQAELNDFRWTALLVYNNDDKKKFHCGGSLISERYVLTAAHCFILTPIAVRLGEYDLRTAIDCAPKGKYLQCSGPHEDIGIEKTIVPREYIFGSFAHDIALVRLERPVEFKAHIRPICLPITKELQTQFVHEYLVAGWGKTENGSSSDVLLYTSIPKRKPEFCLQKLGISSFQGLNDGQICAGGDRLYDTCKGDSGNSIFYPAIYTDGVARVIQYGVVSTGLMSCGEVSAPAIYTNVSHYIQWITDHMSIS